MIPGSSPSCSAILPSANLADVSQLPHAVVDRLRHYFLTYKTIPGDTRSTITVDPVYSAMEARAVLMAAREDYRGRFEEPSPDRS